MLLISDPVFLEHAVPRGHPERPERLTALLAHWQQQGILDRVRMETADPVDAALLSAVHSSEHLQRLTALAPATDLAYVDPDTILSTGSLHAATCAAGAMVQALNVILDGREQRAFCAVRPPGHHAERDNAMGFCLYNSVAVAAASALNHAGVDRVAILDFDVHHGNGTVDIFRDEPRVLVCSSFQHPFYPHRNTNIAAAHLVYTPLPAGSGSDVFRLAIERDWLPALHQHQPDLILVSAGFDAHARDPLAQLQLDSDDFRWVTQLIAAAAERYCAGRVLSTLEGGYDLPALCESATAHVVALIGD